MDVQQAYDAWSSTYDTMVNKTRDLEAAALRTLLADKIPVAALEIGCGTGKNTVWLAEKASHVTAADFSADMLAKAKEKVSATNVAFVEMDIRQPWRFAAAQFDLITCSLVLEHISDLGGIFAQASKVLHSNGLFYIGELHPFKQYQGSKARFDQDDVTLVLDCFTHHISDFTKAAKQHGFHCIELTEWFDDAQKTEAPRVLAMLFQKQ